LGFAAKDEARKELFAPFGEVKSAKVINDRETGRSRGFGSVEMNLRISISKKDIGRYRNDRDD